MKKIILSFLATVLIIATAPVNGQKKLALDDRAQFLNEEIERIVSNRLADDSTELTSIIDNKTRCDYWFATLVKEDNELKLSIADCNDKIAGTKILGSMINSAEDSEKAILLYYAISEIINNPYKVVEVRTDGDSISGEGIVKMDPQHHNSRYFFAPSSYNLKKGELYLNTLYFLLYDVQYGVSNYFSVGLGSSIFGFPMYITPKITIPISDKSAFAIGDMLMIGTYGTNFTGNLLYGTYTAGGNSNNITIGGGFLTLGGKDVSSKFKAPVFNLSGLAKLAGNIFLITENYMSPVKVKSTAYYWQTQDYRSEEFDQRAFFIYGLTGFRFINRTHGLISWQFGLSYVLTSYSDPPYAYTGGGWSVDKRGGTSLIGFPVVGFARKFSVK